MRDGRSRDPQRTADDDRSFGWSRSSRGSGGSTSWPNRSARPATSTAPTATTSARSGCWGFPGSQPMADGVLEKFIRDYIADNDAPQVEFEWQGGEPTLLGIEFFRKVVDLQRKHCPPQQAGAQQPANQRPAAGRRLVPLPPREPFSGRPEHRRPEEAARRLPRDQGGPADVRPRLRRRQAAEETWRRLQHPDGRPPAKRPAAAGRLPLSLA